MKTKNKKKHRPTKTDRPPTNTQWFPLLGLLSALFIGVWLWMRRKTDPPAVTTAQTDTDTLPVAADSITYMGSPMHEFNSNEFNPNEFA